MITVNQQHVCTHAKEFKNPINYIFYKNKFLSHFTLIFTTGLFFMVECIYLIMAIVKWLTFTELLILEITNKFFNYGQRPLHICMHT